LKTLALAALALLGACHRAPPPADPETQFIATTREWIEAGQEIGGTRADAVRKTCKHRPEIADCAIVLPRLRSQ
jgi:hypothetical protein